MIDGSGTEAGHIIVTTIGGRNGQPKQVKKHFPLHHAKRGIMIFTSVLAQIAEEPPASAVRIF